MIEKESEFDEDSVQIQSNWWYSILSVVWIVDLFYFPFLYVK